MKLLLFTLSLALSLKGAAQLMVDTVSNPVASIEDIFIGNGVFTSGLVFSGTNDQFGLFDGSASNIGLNAGVVISTGAVLNAMIDNGSFPTLNNGGDVDLESITGYQTFDLGSMEFDFLATGDSMSFQFVFASDEYPEWVGSYFNDVFGFFVSGPGIEGPFTNAAVNIAVVPGTGDIISINTINATTNPDYYIENVNFETHFCDGYTTVMVAAIGQLQIGESYHMKIAITDVSDSALDSWVFLGGESFSQFCTVSLLEEQERGSAVCMVSHIEAMAVLPDACGTVQLTNTSDMNAPYTSAYYTMGDGNSVPAEFGTQYYSYSEPGEYEIWLVYEVNQFRSKAYVATVQVEVALPAPFIAEVAGVLTIINYDDVNPLPSFQWYLDGMPIEGATGTSVILSGAGVFSVIVMDDCPVQSNIFIVVGVEEQASSALVLYPNPVEGPLTLRWSGVPAQFRVMNQLGQVVAAGSLGNTPVVLPDLPAGMYHVVVHDAEGVMSTSKSIISLN
ncbi:MAG: choice-of-anchor L domain-containing protein [Flavobacteriales bacterium]